jgi:hypothetical protein
MQSVYTFDYLLSFGKRPLFGQFGSPEFANTAGGRLEMMSYGKGYVPLELESGEKKESDAEPYQYELEVLSIAVNPVVGLSQINKERF